MEPETDFIPRIALLVANEAYLSELERILRSHYSGLMLITAREKFREFVTPLLIITDTIDDVAGILNQHPVPGTQLLIVVRAEESEGTSAAFEAGAADFIEYPFVPADVIEKTEKYLESFRRALP